MMHSGSQSKSVFSRLSNPRSQFHLRSDVSVICDSLTGCEDDKKKKRNVGSVFSRLSYGPAVVVRKNDSHQRPCSDLANKKHGTGSGYSSSCQSHSREIASSNSNADNDPRGKRSISNVMVNNSGGRAQLVVDFKHQSAARKSKDEVPPKTKAKRETPAAGEREDFSLVDMPPKRRRKLVRPSFSLENKDEDSQPATLPASSIVAPPGTTSSSCVATPAAADSPSACIAPCAADSSSVCVAQRAASPSSCVATPAAVDSSSARVAQCDAFPSSCVATPAAADSPSRADASSDCFAQRAASPSSSVAPPTMTIPTSKKRPRELMEEEETRMPPKRARLSCMCVHADAALAKAQLELMKLSLGSSDEDVNKVGWSPSPAPALLSLSRSSVEDDNKVGLAPLSLCRSDEYDKEVTPAQTTAFFSSHEDDEKVASALLLTPVLSSSRSEEDAIPQPAPVSVVTTVAAHDVDDDIFTRVASILARDIIDELDLPGRYAETQKMIDRCTEIQNRIDKILWIYGY